LLDDKKLEEEMLAKNKQDMDKIEEY